MENLADRPFRRAIAANGGGFDEACTEFMRIPSKSENPLGSVKGVTGWYDACELGSVPLGAQIMGSNPEILALAARHLVEVKHAPRVDLNCGCPANTVTGNGAGSSLLRTPDLLARNVAAMVAAVGGRAPVSVKMRSGFDDTALFRDNLLAAQEAGAAFITLHPRTKRQCYDGRADWSLTTAARTLLRVPVVGNGDVVCAASARQLLAETGCHGLMVGRGAVQDPLLFARIRFAFERPDAPLELDEPEVVQAFLRAYASHFIPPEESPEEPSHTLGLGCATGYEAAPSAAGWDDHRAEREAKRKAAEAVAGPACSRRKGGPRVAGQFGRLKKVTKYLFVSSTQLQHACEELLRRTPDECSASELLELLCRQVAAAWPAGGPSRRVLVDHMTKSMHTLVAV